MSNDLLQQLEIMEQRWKKRKEQLATKEDIWGTQEGIGGLAQTLRNTQKRLGYWLVGIAVANIALSQLLRYVLETYF